MHRRNHRNSNKNRSNDYESFYEMLKFFSNKNFTRKILCLAIQNREDKMRMELFLYTNAHRFHYLSQRFNDN